MGTYDICIKDRTSNGTFLVPLITELFSNRVIFIDGEITSSLATSFLKQLIILTQKDNITPIKVLINSPGGEMDAGLMMYDIIQTCKTPIQMYCVGIAYSMAAVLFLSGNHGRYILEHSRIMIHEPLVKNLTGGNVTNINSVSNSLKKSKRQIDELISKHSGKSLKEIEKSTSYDHFFSAKEAIDYGLADKIIGLDDLFAKEGN